MSFLVIELQTNAGETAGILTSHADRQEAESKYHAVLAAAAVSGVETHAAAILTPEGFQLMAQSYSHLAREDA